MALSLLSHPSYTDLQQSFFDTSSILRNNTTNNNIINSSNINNNNNINYIDYYSFSNDEMEFNSNSINGQNSSNHHNANNNYNDYEQVIDFVDSPPNSKESWPGDYTKEDQPPGPTIVDVQTIYSNNSNRKRRMDWDELNINQTNNNNNNDNDHNTKILNLDDNKEPEKKKSTGRGSWADDIDFDLNGEFSNNGYLNNAESFLSFSPALTVLKQEIPSPSSDLPQQQQQQQKGNKSPHQQNLNTDKLQQENDNNQQESSINGSPQHHQQQQQKQGQQQGSHSTLDNGLNANSLGTNFQQLLQQQENLDNTSARNSPHHTDNIKSDTASDDNKFQYILAAATSIATKSNEETLTYLNQGQSYEIKLKKIGDLSYYRDKLLKSVIKICFHERRLQYMEREQMQQWQSARPGERIIEVDIPLSYGLCHVTQSLNQQYLNTVDILWDPMKEVGVYIKVNCISTEFTPKKHGGEKGVPFRIQIETYLENGTTINNNTTNLINNNNNNSTTSTTPTININNNNNNNTNTNNINNNNNNNSPTNAIINNTNSDNCLGKPIHAAACQIKVFKLKGADRKHKQDREKIQRRPPSEQEKYQPSYECTILNDISLDSITSNSTTTGCLSPEYMKIWPNSPVHMPKYEGILPFTSTNSTTNNINSNIPSPIAINSVTSTNTNNLKLMDQNMVSPQQIDMDDYAGQITKDSTPVQVSQWLTYHRLSTYLGTFAHFSGSDILRMSKEDLIQVCGLADGIRMFNILHAKAITPRLTIYISFDGSSYHAIYLISNTIKELTYKIFKLPGFFEMCANGGTNINGIENNNGYPGWGMLSKYSGSGSNIYKDASKLNIYTTGPSGIHVMVNDEVLSNAIKDNSLYSLEMLNGKILMKSVNKIDNI